MPIRIKKHEAGVCPANVSCQHHSRLFRSHLSSVIFPAPVPSILPLFNAIIKIAQIIFVPDIALTAIAA